VSALQEASDWTVDINTIVSQTMEFKFGNGRTRWKLDV
jgi:hypothetical protein